MQNNYLCLGTINRVGCFQGNILKLEDIFILKACMSTLKKFDKVMYQWQKHISALYSHWYKT